MNDPRKVMFAGDWHGNADWDIRFSSATDACSNATKSKAQGRRRRPILSRQDRSIRSPASRSVGALADVCIDHYMREKGFAGIKPLEIEDV